MIRAVTILQNYLEYLDSHDGRLLRRNTGGNETDMDCIAVIPNPPGAAIFTVGDAIRSQTRVIG